MWCGNLTPVLTKVKANRILDCKFSTEYCNGLNIIETWSHILNIGNTSMQAWPKYINFQMLITFWVVAKLKSVKYKTFYFDRYCFNALTWNKNNILTKEYQPGESLLFSHRIFPLEWFASTFSLFFSGMCMCDSFHHVKMEEKKKLFLPINCEWERKGCDSWVRFESFVWMNVFVWFFTWKIKCPSYTFSKTIVRGFCSLWLMSMKVF